MVWQKMSELWEALELDLNPIFFVDSCSVYIIFE